MLLELPKTFQGFKLDENERQAALMFVDRAAQATPGVEVVGPRRSSSGRLKIVTRFPDGVDAYDAAAALISLIQTIEDETGIYLHLD